MGILSFNAKFGSENYFTVELLDGDSQQLLRIIRLDRKIRNESGRLQAVWGIPQIQNQGHLRLVPNSEFLAVSRRGSQNILLHYYGERGHSSRIIRTAFTGIADVKVGRYEKLIHVFDSSANVLAEYSLPEIGCPSADSISSCSKYFRD